MSEFEYSKMLEQVNAETSGGAGQMPPMGQMPSFQDPATGMQGQSQHENNSMVNQGTSIDEIDKLNTQYNATANMQQPAPAPAPGYMQPMSPEQLGPEAMLQQPEPLMQMPHMIQPMVEQVEDIQEKPSKGKRRERRKKTSDSIIDLIFNKNFMIGMMSFFVVTVLLNLEFVSLTLYRFVRAAFTSGGKISTVGIVLKSVLGLMMYITLNVFIYTFT